MSPPGPAWGLEEQPEEHMSEVKAVSLDTQEVERLSNELKQAQEEIGRLRRIENLALGSERVLSQSYPPDKPHPDLLTMSIEHRNIFVKLSMDMQKLEKKFRNHKKALRR